MTANSFKEGYRNHIKSFKDGKYSNETELSKYIWDLKSNNQSFSIKWAIMKRAVAYTSGAKRCNLRLEEKLCIMKACLKKLQQKIGDHLKDKPHEDNSNESSNPHKPRCQ